MTDTPNPNTNEAQAESAFEAAQESFRRTPNPKTPEDIEVPAVEPTADIPALMLQIRDAAACRYAAGLSDGSRDAGASSFSEADAEELFTKIEAAITRLAASSAAPVAEPPIDEKRYPYYELRFIMRVLGHKGRAPEEDWTTAYGMARDILIRWHNDRLAASPAAQPVPAHVEPMLVSVLLNLQAASKANPYVSPELAKAQATAQVVLDTYPSTPAPQADKVTK